MAEVNPLERVSQGVAAVFGLAMEKAVQDHVEGYRLTGQGAVLFISNFFGGWQVKAHIPGRQPAMLTFETVPQIVQQLALRGLVKRN